LLRRKTSHGPRDFGPLLPCEQRLLRICPRGYGQVDDRGFSQIVQHRQQPTLATLPRAFTVETAIHQDPREPDLERMLRPERFDVNKGLDESVLRRVIGIGRIAQVVKRDL